MKTLAEFKTERNINKLRFYKSTKSDRFVAGFAGDKTVVTTVDYDPKKPGFIYDNPEAPGNSFILSNREPKKAEFEL